MNTRHDSSASPPLPVPYRAVHAVHAVPPPDPASGSHPARAEILIASEVSHVALSGLPLDARKTVPQQPASPCQMEVGLFLPAPQLSEPITATDAGTTFSTGSAQPDAAHLDFHDVESSGVTWANSHKRDALQRASEGLTASSSSPSASAVVAAAAACAKAELSVPGVAQMSAMASLAFLPRGRRSVAAHIQPSGAAVVKVARVSTHAHVSRGWYNDAGALRKTSAPVESARTDSWAHAGPTTVAATAEKTSAGWFQAAAPRERHNGTRSELYPQRDGAASQQGGQRARLEQASQRRCPCSVGSLVSCECEPGPIRCGLSDISEPIAYLPHGVAHIRSPADVSSDAKRLLCPGYSLAGMSDMKIGGVHSHLRRLQTAP